MRVLGLNVLPCFAGLLCFASLACGAPMGDGGAKPTDEQRLLEVALASSNERGMGEVMKRHGGVRADEIPLLVAALEGGSAQRRQNAARLLSIARAEDATPALREVVRSHVELPVWAIALNAICGDEQLPTLLATREEMTRRALESEDPEHLEAGICAAAVLRLPDLQAQTARLLAREEGDVRAAAARVVDLSGLEALVPLLLARLPEEQDPVAYRALVTALTHRDGPEVWAALRDAHEGGDRHQRQVILNALTFSEQPRARDMLLGIAAKKTPESVGALFALSRSPDRAFIETCLQLLAHEPAQGEPGRSSWLSIAQPCVQGVERLAGAPQPNTEAALSFAHRWLEENPPTDGAREPRGEAAGVPVELKNP